MSFRCEQPLKRSETLQVMSVLCALLVVYIHLPPARLDGPIGVVFYHFLSCVSNVAVPFFFLASGYFLAAHVYEEGWYVRAVKQRLYSLVCPYVIWNTLFFLFITVLGISNQNLPPAARGFTLVSIYSLDLISGPVLHPTWYLRALFIVVCVSPVVVFAMKRMWRCTIILLIVIYVTFSLYPFQSLALGRLVYFGISMAGLFYFAIGVMLRTHPNVRIKLMEKFLKYKWLLLLCAIVACAVQLVFRHHPVVVSVLRLLEIFLILPTLYLFCRCLPGILRFSGYAMPIYLTHLFICALADQIAVLKCSKVLMMLFVFVFVVALAHMLLKVPFPILWGGRRLSEKRR